MTGSCFAAVSHPQHQGHCSALISLARHRAKRTVRMRKRFRGNRSGNRRSLSLLVGLLGTAAGEDGVKASVDIR